jgi:3-deoxy-7-phosphoheptulonate synthase
LNRAEVVNAPLNSEEEGLLEGTLDTTRVDDLRIGAVRPLISPALLQDEMPLTRKSEAVVERSRADIARVLAGQDDRLVVVVGPAPSTTTSRPWPTGRSCACCARSWPASWSS